MKKLITQNPNILGGKPIIAGTRMSVEVILEFLAGGMEIKEMLKEYPFLTREQIQAAIEYAAGKVGSAGTSKEKRENIKLLATPPTAIRYIAGMNSK
ncbi:DUF433 domain-containing protein [Candidatus Curtissbacteria bacterium]|nr:DUF433 domain-containing protein [Candidatus Curtissbacteria bacterium]